MTAQDPQASGHGEDSPPRRRVGRRGLIGAAGASLLVGGGVGYGLGRSGTGSGPGDTATGGADGSAGPDGSGGADAHLSRAYPLRGAHQAGIVTPAQDYMFTAAFDVTAHALDDLRDLMSTWCVAAEQMTAGELVGGTPDANRYAAPRDTGEVWGYPPSSLTLTFGVGGSLFVDAKGKDRFGLKKKAPRILLDGMPRFANEQLQPAVSDGDLVVQACADDAQVAMHAIRNLTRIAFGTATLRWTQIGYGRTSSTSTTQETPRNLFGFKDGTANVKAEDGADVLAKHLWVGTDDDAGDWLAGGTYMCARKIRMLMEIWDRQQLLDQEETIGRDKRFGAPLSVPDVSRPAQEFTAADYEAKAVGSGGGSGGGGPAIPADAHIRIVAPEQNHGARMLRRGYNYTDGNDSLGRINGGLFFLAFVRDPTTGFYPILDRMTKDDALTEYLQHVASGLFAVLPGVGEKDTMIGQNLFGAR
jgi:deferrochelatase/peroxidase EfeB